MVKISLTRFKVVGYRSCKNTEIDVSPNITALIGPNGVGKTNLLQAVMLYGQPAGPYFGKETNSLKCRVEVDFLRARKLVQYRAIVTYRTDQANKDEALTFDEQWNFSGSKSEKNGWMSLDDKNYHSHKKKGRLYFSIPAKGRQSKIKASDVSQALAASRSSSKKEQAALAKAEMVAQDIHVFAASIKYYSASLFTNPGLCPTSFEIDEDRELRQENAARRSPHSKFLHELYTLSKADPETYDLYLSFVDKRGVGLINGFSWRAVEFLSETREVRGGGKIERKKKERILIIPTVRIGASRLSFNQLSEGTFRALALIFYIVSDKNPMMIIEEPEVCVHHGLLSSVVSILKEYGRTKQIIFSTHSERVVDNLEPDQLRLVEFTPRRGTIVKRLSEKFSKNKFEALKGYLATTGSLGEYWTHSGF